MPLITYNVISNLICIIYSRIFSWVFWVVVDKFHTYKDTFWDKIIHQIRDHLISFFIPATWIVFHTGGGWRKVSKSTWNTIQVAMMKKLMSREGGGRTPILEDGGELPLYWPPVFDIFQSHWVPFLCPTRSFCRKKICLSLSHLVPEIIWPKVGLFCHKNLSFDTLEAICTTFLLHFRSFWPPIFIVIRYFWLFIFTKP